MASRYPNTGTKEFCDKVTEKLVRKLEEHGRLEENIRRDVAQTIRDECRDYNISPFQSFSLNDSTLNEDVSLSTSGQRNFSQQVKSPGESYRETGQPSQTAKAQPRDEAENMTPGENVTSATTPHFSPASYPTCHHQRQGGPRVQDQLTAPGAVGGAGADECTASAPQLRQGTSTTCPYCSKDPSKHIVRPITDGGKEDGRYDNLHVLHERRQDEENA